MKFIKMLGLAVVAAAALMALGVSTASATILTDEEGNHPTSITATSTEGTLQGAAGIHIVCNHSHANITMTEDGTDPENNEKLTPEGTVDSLTFKECAPWTVTVLQGGTLSISGDVVKSSNAEVTALRSDGIHCVYQTNNTSVGTLTESSETEGTAVLDINGTIPRTSGKSGVFCGTNGKWVGNYQVTSPDVLNID